MRLVFLLLALGIISTNAGVPQGAVEIKRLSVNGTDVSTQGVTVQFTQSDSTYVFGQVSATGPEWFIINTRPELYSYSTLALKYGPENLYVYVNRACATDAITDINITTQVYEPISGGRRLLSQRHERGLLSTDAQYGQDIDSSDMAACLGTVMSGGIAVGGGVGVTVSGVVTWGRGLGDGNCNNLNQAINSKLDGAVAKADQALDAATLRWDANITAVFVGFDKLNSYMTIALDAQAKSNMLVNQTFDQVRQAMEIQANNVDLRFNATQTTVQLLGNQTVAALIALDQQTDAKLYLVQQNFANTTQRLVSLINGTIGMINTNQRRDDNNLRELTRTLRAFQSNIVKGIAGTNGFIDEQLLSKIWTALGDMNAQGRIAMMDPTLPGVPPIDPSTFTTDDLTAFVDKQYINFVNITASVTRIHQIGINFYVNIPAMIQRNQMAGDWRDIQELIGTPDCTKGAGPGSNPVIYCTGWFEITHTYCTRPTAPTPFVWESVRSTSNRDVYTLGVAQCGVAPTVDPIWNGRRIDTLEALNDFMGPGLCSIDAFVAGSQLQLYSMRTGAVSLAPDYSQVACTVDTTSMLVDGTLTVPNIQYAMYRRWEQGMQVMMSERNIFAAKLTGLRPRGFTNTYLPFYGLSNGHAYSCFETDITAFSPETQIYYRTTPIGVTPQVSIKVYDAEPIKDCSVTPCVVVPQGNFKRDVIPNSINIGTMSPENGIYDPSILPSSSSIMFGELTPGTMASVFDLPPSAANLAPNSRSRDGQADYTSWSIPSGYSVANTASGGPPPGNLPIWEAENPGLLYDHTASISPAFYEHTVQTSDGVCNIVAGVPFNTICNLLQNFVVDPSTDMRRGTLGLRPRFWKVTINFDAVVGPIIERVQDGCPDLSFDPNNILGRVLILTNSLPYDIRVLVVRTNTDGACPTADYRATIPGKGVETVPFAACGNYTAQVYSIPADSTASPVACGAPLAAVLQQPTQDTSAISTLVNTTAIAVTNSLSIGFAQTDLALIGIMLNIISSQIPGISLTVAGVDFTSLTTNSSLQAALAAILSTANGFDVTSHSAADAIAPFMAQINNLQAQQSVLINIIAEVSANATRQQAENTVLVGNVQTGLVELTKLTAEKSALQDAYIAQASSTSGYGYNRGCSSLGFPSNFWCYLQMFLLYTGLAAAGGVLVYGLYMLYVFLYNRSASRRQHPTYENVQQAQA